MPGVVNGPEDHGDKDGDEENSAHARLLSPPGTEDHQYHHGPGEHGGLEKN